MKNIIDSKLRVRVTGDNMENMQVRELEKKYGFYIDETYIAEEDGEVLVDGKPVPFKAGDMIAIYGIWVRGNSNELGCQTVVIPSTDQLAISLKKTIEKTINTSIKESILSCNAKSKADENNM